MKIWRLLVSAHVGVFVKGDMEDGKFVGFHGGHVEMNFFLFSSRDA